MTIRSGLALCALLALSLAACTRPAPPSANATTPGYTGYKIIPGNSSTIAGDAPATRVQQYWGFEGHGWK